MALLSSRSWHEWLSQYAESHRHPKNRFCHTVGIPLVAASVALLPLCAVIPQLLPVAASVFAIGWIFQLVGHAYEGKPPEFTRDWRFLFVGLRWWFAKMRGQV
jgi:uncharacterized membrane protein YGL010W